MSILIQLNRLRAKSGVTSSTSYFLNHVLALSCGEHLREAEVADNVGGGYFGQPLQDSVFKLMQL